MTPNASPSCSVSDVVRAVEAIAPPVLAEPWDNVGLQVGHPAARARRVMTCLELTPSTLAEAVERGADTLVAHHPLLFKPLTALNLAQPVGELAGELVRRGLALIAAHTNLDAARWGTNAALAEACGLTPEEPLNGRDGEPQYKFVVFVPRGNELEVIDAIARGGGGRIGAYTHCTFRSIGTGTFFGAEGAQPRQGRPGRLEHAEEYRLEALVADGARRAVLREVRAVHPYEEMAYEFLPVSAGEPTEGLGCIAKLEHPMPAIELARSLKQRLGLAMVRLSGDQDRRVRRAAICSGSGGSCLGRAAVRAEALVTGEINYHQGIEAHQRGVAVIELGHFESEVLVARPLAARLATDEKLAAAGVEVFAAEHDLQPFRYL